MVSVFGPVEEVHVPGTFANMGRNACFLNVPEATPRCVPPLKTDTTIRPATTLAGRYPPLYYALLALPVRLFPSLRGVYVMRLVTALVCAAFLASAFESAGRLGRWTVLGVAVATTPVVLYFAGAVNPSALELASAIAVWGSAAAIARAPKVDQRLLARAAIAYAVCANTRSLSLAFASAALVTSLLLASRARWRELLHRRDALGWGAVAAASAAPVVGWAAYTGIQRRLFKPSFTFVDGLNRTPTVFSQSVANYWYHLTHSGFVGKSSSPVAVIVWLAAVTIMVALALARGRLWDDLVLLAVLLLSVLVPIAISMAEIPPIYDVWQGRYGLPLAAGVPILAGLISTTRTRGAWSLPRVTGSALALVLGAAQLLCFAVLARRYAVTNAGPILYMLHPVWGGTLRSSALLLVAAVGIGALSWRVVVTPETVAAALPGEAPAPGRP